MPAQTFPTALFGFLEQEVDIEGQVLDGGQAISGEVDRVATDGGGRVFAEFGKGDLVDRNKVLAWRALLANLENGVEEMIVPFCDLRHQPYGNEHTVTYGDGAFHSDGSPFVGGGAFAESTADADLRATTLEFNGAFATPLLGGEWFGIDHATKGWRAYKVRTVDNDLGILTFRPPLREATPEGTPLDFAEPRCLMVQDGRASARLQVRRQTTASIRFVESR
jgi:hypothetical protein